MSQVPGFHPITHGLRSPSFRGSAKLIAAKRPKSAIASCACLTTSRKRGGGGSYGADYFSFDLRTVQKAQNFNMALPFTHFVNNEVFSTEFYESFGVFRGTKLFSKPFGVGFLANGGPLAPGFFFQAPIRSGTLR